ncbi:DUF4158 domain-containing protein [Bacillus cereus group sp. IBL03679]|uniref:DUF4158 domain-containing protein n=1 Tax=Bacillus cereus group sp. IBL03679 TaxID=3240095 RepID=UPI003D2F79A4
MKRNWNAEELIEFFTLLPNDVDLAIKNKTDINRLGFAVLFKYFQYKAAFPNQKQDIPSVVLTYIAKQLHLSPDLFHQYSWVEKKKHIQDIDNKYEVFWDFEH